MGASAFGQDGGPGAPRLGPLTEVGLRLLLRTVPAIIWTCDRDLRCTAFVGHALESLGLRPGELMGRSLYEYFARRESTFSLAAAHTAALNGEAREIECEWQGRTFTVAVEPLAAAGQVSGGAIAVAVDVTDLRRAERAARSQMDDGRTARPEASSGLERMLVNRLGDILTGVAAGADRLLSEIPRSDPRRLEVEALIEGTSRGAELLRSLRDADRQAPPQDLGRLAPTEGAETILLVEDDPQVRSFVRRALEEDGYHVLEAARVEDAMALGSSYPGHIHLLLSDVVLPGMNGPELATRLAPLRPEMRMLYMTGYADAAVVHRGVLSAGQALLLKPFTAVGLVHEVRRMLRA